MDDFDARRWYITEEVYFMITYVNGVCYCLWTSLLCIRSHMLQDDQEVVSSRGHVSMYEAEVYAPDFLRILETYKSLMGDSIALKAYVDKLKGHRDAILEVHFLPAYQKAIIKKKILDLYDVDQLGQVQFSRHGRGKGERRGRCGIGGRGKGERWRLRGR